MSMKSSAALSVLLSVVILSGAAFAQGADEQVQQTLRPTTVFYGESPPLSELALHPAEVAPGNGQLFEFELDEIYEVPSDAPFAQPTVPPLLQTFAPTPMAAVAGARMASVS